ncbi:15648_t:CDS:2, partial [Funneliformis geosporum]
MPNRSEPTRGAVSSRKRRIRIRVPFELWTEQMFQSALQRIINSPRPNSSRSSQPRPSPPSITIKKKLGLCDLYYKIKVALLNLATLYIYAVLSWDIFGTWPGTLEDILGLSVGQSQNVWDIEN